MKIDNRNIAHLSDLHVRFGSRHEEHRIVFKRTVEDLKKIKPRRIIITGDLFHQKINLSPGAIEILTEFLRELSVIAPVDIILGNHDMNEQDLNQGNTIKPIIDLIDNGIIINSDVDNIPVVDGKHSIYFYHDSGFYNIDDELVYGVFSLWDHEILTLDKKKPGKKYIALYHGAVYGCMSDSGYIMKGDELIRTSTFNNFDMVMLGDIHEHQVFELNNKYSMAYAGSILQNNIGESIDKGYLLWNIDECDFEFRHILNDYGFAKITIDKGEIWQDRLDNLRLSFNPKKTKVFVEIVDDAENENVEKKSQIKKYIKQKWGCEFIDVQYQRILKIKVLGVDTDAFDLLDPNQWESLLISYLKENDFDNTDDVIELSREVDKELNFKPNTGSNAEWDLISMTTSNVFSHPVSPTYFPPEKLQGIVGIFGKNFSGKSNVIKALIWGLYQQILGGGVGDNHKVVNMYTGKNSAYVEIVISVMGQKYKIFRGIEIKKKKDGTTKAEYKIDLSYASGDGDDETWIPSESDRGVKEKPEIKKMVLDTIGTFDNFTKVSLQTQGGKDDYLSLAQQEKNTLLREYTGLLPCDMRYDIVNKKFNQVKNLQKNLGDPTVIEKQIEDEKNLILENQIFLNKVRAEKDEFNLEIEKHNDEILNLTKQIIKLENLSETNPDILESNLKQYKNNIVQYNMELNLKNTFLKNNFLREIPSGFEGVTIADLDSKILSEKNKFKTAKNDYLLIQEWLKSNITKEVHSIVESEMQLDKAKEKLLILKNDLIISKGKKCPTCGSVTQVADIEKEKECQIKIGKADEFIKEKIKFIEEQKSQDKINQKIIQEELRLGSLKNALETTKLTIEQLSFKQQQLQNISSDLIHNASIKTITDEVFKLKKSIDNNEKLIQENENNLKLLLNNSEKLKKNELLNNQITALQESIKGYKFSVFNADRSITDVVSKIKVQENNIENYTDKLAQIKSSIKTFNKYSIYLQAVSRDGIPTQILRKRLPAINYKINSILQNIVNFKIELSIKPNGDVIDYYYFNEDKSDALPLSLGSGSQKFIGSIAIRDALHYISCLIKPSFCIIDEGFGTLDDEKVGEIHNVFSYLRNKYKMVMIITHKSEIKDGVDHIITISKTTNGLSKEILDANPEAGISQINFN